MASSPLAGQDVVRLQRRSTTPAYQEAALQVLLDEVNDVARDIGLDEKLPICRSDLLEVVIHTPFWSDHAGYFGSITTRNYHYHASCDNRLSSIDRNWGSDHARAYAALLSQSNGFPKSQVDTNAAHAAAARFLAALGMNVKELDRDSTINVTAIPHGDTFVPHYSVAWSQPHSAGPDSPPPEPGDPGVRNAAAVDLLLPGPRLLQVEVNRSQYIRHPPLRVAGRDSLLQQTTDEFTRKMWFTTDSYKTAALEVLVREANQVCRELALADRQPITSSNLASAIIETPFVADQTGRFGMVKTEAYSYGAFCGGKLSSICRLSPYKGNQERYYAALKAQYAWPWSRFNTNAAYALAARFLAAAGVDVKALEVDHHVEIYPWNLGSRFVPYYEVNWRKGHEPGLIGVAAAAEVLEPENLLCKLYVSDARYLNRKKLVVPNAESLLSQTNTVRTVPSPPRSP